jgi:hypothetical protein
LRFCSLFNDFHGLTVEGSVQGVVDFHWTALTMGILPDESLDAFFAFLAIFGL